MRKEERALRYLESIDNSLRLLLLISSSAKVGVSEAASHLGVAPATAYRLLSTLRFRGFVVQCRDRSYRAGPTLERIVSYRMDRGNLADRAIPVLTSLRDATGETSHFSVLVGQQVRVIASVESTQTLRIGSRTGVMLPAHLSTGGRLLLAELDEADLDELFPPSGLTTPALPPSAMETLRRDLARCRKQGYAVNNEMTERGVSAVGVLVCDDDGPVGALSVTLPTLRYTPAALPRLVQQLSEARDLLASLLHRG